MGGEPLVSVVIPTYKRSAIVPNAISSVLNQTYGNLEVLVVDDCSPDDTGSVVQGIADSRIRYLRHDKNKGLPAVRNTGIRAATGEFIAFLDDDDEWRSDKLEKQIPALKDYDAVLCMGVADGCPSRVHNRPNITLDDLKKGSFYPSSLLVKASALREVMFDESLRQGEDWDALIRIGQRYRMGWIPEPLLLYNRGVHERITNEKKYLTGPELEKRTAMLHKHREFFGEKWFEYHLADSLLSYIGSSPNKLQSISYAVRRCGFFSVAANFIHRIGRRLRRLRCTWQRTIFGSGVNRS